MEVNLRTEHTLSLDNSRMRRISIPIGEATGIRNKHIRRQEKVTTKR
ncbi:hypothetical protein [Corynebacterium bovis]